MSFLKNTKHKKLVSDLEKDYKLNLVVGEIERANNEYIRELNEIDNYYLEMETKNINNIVLDKNKKE